MTGAKATTVLNREASKAKGLLADVIVDLSDGSEDSENMRILRVDLMYSPACTFLHMYSLLYNFFG